MEKIICPAHFLLSVFQFCSLPKQAPPTFAHVGGNRLYRQSVVIRRIAFLSYFWIFFFTFAGFLDLSVWFPADERHGRRAGVSSDEPAENGRQTR